MISPDALKAPMFVARRPLGRMHTAKPCPKERAGSQRLPRFDYPFDEQLPIPMHESGCGVMTNEEHRCRDPAVARPRGAMGTLVEEILADARWFPLRLDVRADAFHFAFIPGESHREIAFLQEFRPQPAKTHVVPRSALSNSPVDGSPLHLILHSGLGGSTLLARALAEPGVVTTLQEPPVLTDVIAYGLKTSPTEMQRLLSEVTQLLSRPLSPGETVACKVSAIGNGLGASMAGFNPGSQILCLQTPLDEMLSSFAARGLEGRLAARKLLIGIRNSRMLAFEISDKELGDYTDLQLAALAWLSMQKMMIEAAEVLGPERVASIASERLMQHPRETLSAVAKHFRLSLDAERRVQSGIFERHAKTGEPFDAGRRAERTAERLRVHGAEIEPIAAWARKVAEKIGIAWELPYSLLS
jgi:hypothetical protein